MASISTGELKRLEAELKALETTRSFSGVEAEKLRCVALRLLTGFRALRAEQRSTAGRTARRARLVDAEGVDSAAADSEPRRSGPELAANTFKELELEFALPDGVVCWRCLKTEPDSAEPYWYLSVDKESGWGECNCKNAECERLPQARAAGRPHLNIYEPQFCCKHLLAAASVLRQMGYTEPGRRPDYSTSGM